MAAGTKLTPKDFVEALKDWSILDVVEAVKAIEDEFGIVHAPIGKVSFEDGQLHQNLTALVDALIRNKPSASKGQYLRTLYLSATQGPSVPVDVKEAAKLQLAG